MYSVGLDWGSAVHTACTMDHDGAVIARIEVQHTAEGLRKLLSRLARIAPPPAAR